MLSYGLEVWRVLLQAPVDGELESLAGEVISNDLIHYPSPKGYYLFHLQT